MTQEEIAEKFGVSSRSVSRWENGNTMPELGLLVELAIFYEVDIKEIIDGERKSETMEKEVIETLTKAADYAKEEKKIEIKTKTLFTCIGTILAVAALVLLAWFVRAVPIVDVAGDEVNVKAVYHYMAEDGYKVCVLYESPYTEQTQKSYSYGEGLTMVIKIKKPLWAAKVSDSSPSTHIAKYECGWMSDDNVPDCDAVTFAGETIWTKEKASNDPIPDYVFAYDEYGSFDGRITDWIMGDDYMQALYYDGTSVKWDYAGNVLFDNRNNG